VGFHSHWGCFMVCFYRTGVLASLVNQKARFEEEEFQLSYGWVLILVFITRKYSLRRWTQKSSALKRRNFHYLLWLSFNCLFYNTGVLASAQWNRKVTLKRRISITLWMGFLMLFLYTGYSLRSWTRKLRFESHKRTSQLKKSSYVLCLLCFHFLFDLFVIPLPGLPAVSWAPSLQIRKPRGYRCLSFFYSKILSNSNFSIKKDPRLKKRQWFLACGWPRGLDSP